MNQAADEVLEVLRVNNAPIGIGAALKYNKTAPQPTNQCPTPETRAVEIFVPFTLSAPCPRDQRLDSHLQSTQQLPLVYPVR